MSKLHKNAETNSIQDVDYQKLSIYNFYKQQAMFLIKELVPYNDAYSEELKRVLNNFITNPVRDLSEMISEIQEPITVASWFLKNFDINATLSEIDYPEEEWFNTKSIA